MKHQQLFKRYNIRTYRYMDDLLQIYKPQPNYSTEITFKSIYDAALNVECTNITDREANFLDLTINIIEENNEIITKLYNKTDDYNFRIRRYPHYTSNIPISLGLNTIKGEIIRFSRCCNKFEDFKTRIEGLIQDFKYNQFPNILIYNRILRVIKSNFLINNKYDKTKLSNYLVKFK